jgi:hypothetical protein
LNINIVFMSASFTSNYEVTKVFHENPSCFDGDIVTLVENEATFTYDVDGMNVKLRDVKKDQTVDHNFQIFLLSNRTKIINTM